MVEIIVTVFNIKIMRIKHQWIYIKQKENMGEQKRRGRFLSSQCFVSQNTKLSDELSKSVPLHKIAGSELEVNLDTCECW